MSMLQTPGSVMNRTGMATMTPGKLTMQQRSSYGMFMVWLCNLSLFIIGLATEYYIIYTSLQKVKMFIL